MPGQIFPDSYEGWLSPKTGKSPYKVIDDPAIIRKKNAIRESLREEYLKRMYNPYRRATGVGGAPFDPAWLRYEVMARTCHQYFRPGPKVWWSALLMVVAPIVTVCYIQESYNRKFAEMIRRGELSYVDRMYRLTYSQCRKVWSYKAQ